MRTDSPAPAHGELLLLLGQAESSIRARPQLARELAARARALAEGVGSREDALKARLISAEAGLNLSEFDEVASELRAMDGEVPTLDRPLLSYQHALLAARYQLRSGEVTAALESYARLYEQVDPERHPELSARILLGLSAARARSGLLQEAIESYQQCMPLYEKAGNRVGLLFCMSGLAACYMYQNKYAQALEHETRALALAVELGDESAQAMSRHNTATVYIWLEEWVPAEALLQQALATRIALNDLDGEAASRVNLGISLLGQERLDEAQVHLERALEIAQETGSRRVLPELLLNLGRLELARDNSAQAWRWLSQGFELAAGLGRHPLLPVLYADAARARLGSATSEEDWALVDDLARRAVRLGSDLASAEVLGMAYLVLVDTHEHRGEMAQALGALRKASEAQMRAHTERSNQRLQSLRLRLDLDLAQQEAVRERRRREELAAALEEAERQRLRAEEQERRAQMLARRDPLTGIFNRRALEERLPEEHLRERRFHHGLAVAMIDVDHFKRINDLHSHMVGDRVLRALTRLLLAGCRRGDFLGRYGGEEFALLLPEVGLEAAALTCERLRARIERFGWGHIAPGLEVTISIGVASDSGQSWRQLLQEADMALGMAKSQGRNRVVTSRRDPGAQGNRGQPPAQ